MTSLKKPVVRRCAVLRDGGAPVVVSLEPGDVLAFRRLRSRTYFRAKLADLFVVTVQWQVEQERRAKLKKKKK